MTNTIFGALFLLSAILIITLYSCNRNNTKSEIANENELKDTTAISEMSIDSMANSTDSLQTGIEQTDSTQMDTLVQSKKTGERLITDDDDEQIKQETMVNKSDELSDSVKASGTEKTPDETSQNLSLKENIDKPKTGENKGGGLRATGAIKKDAAKRILIVGSGGGVTGAVNEYRIEVDGSVYEKKSLGETASRKKGLQTNQIQQINQQFDALDFDNLKYNNPGNLYYYIGYELNGKTHNELSK